MNLTLSDQELEDKFLAGYRYFIYTGNYNTYRSLANKHIFELKSYSFDQNNLVFKNLVCETGWVHKRRHSSHDWPFIEVSDIPTDRLPDILCQGALDLFPKFLNNHYANLELATKPKTQHKQGKMKKPKMTQVKDDIVASNRAAVTTAAMITSGDLIMKNIMPMISKQLPMPARGYLDHPLAEVLVANLVVAGLSAANVNNSKAEFISDAMLTSAMTKLVRMIDIESLMDKALKGVDLPEDTKAD